MVGWLLLTGASALGCPWADHTIVRQSRWVRVVEVCEPVVQWVEPARDCAPVTVAPQKNPEASAAIADAAAVELAAASDIVTEPAAFAFPGSGLLTSTALDWGVATIGPGTLYPNWGVPGGGGMFWPGGNSSGSNTAAAPAATTPVGAVPTLTASEQNPVPEPLSVVLWVLGLGWLAARRSRRKSIDRCVPNPSNG